MADQDISSRTARPRGFAPLWIAIPAGRRILTTRAGLQMGSSYGLSELWQTSGRDGGVQVLRGDVKTGVTLSPDSVPLRAVAHAGRSGGLVPTKA